MPALFLKLNEREEDEYWWLGCSQCLDKLGSRRSRPNLVCHPARCTTNNLLGQTGKVCIGEVSLAALRCVMMREGEEGYTMAHTLTIPDEVYQQLRALAEVQGQTPESLVAALVDQATRERARDPLKEPRHQTFEEFFYDLGMTDEQIAAAKQRAANHADL